MLSKEAKGIYGAMCHNILVRQIIVYHREWQQLKGSGDLPKIHLLLRTSGCFGQDRRFWIGHPAHESQDIETRILDVMDRTECFRAGHTTYRGQDTDTRTLGC